MRFGRRPRFAPGGLVLVLASARKSVARAFCFGGCSSIRATPRRAVGSNGKRLFRAAAEPQETATTPPESPWPPGDGDMVSFYLLRHGQTNFNAIGRIQVGSRVLCVCVVERLGAALVVKPGCMKC